MQEGFPRDLGYRLHRQKDRKPACLLAFCLSAQWIEYGKCHALLTLIFIQACYMPQSVESVRRNLFGMEDWS